MKMNQVYDLANEMTKQILGETVVLEQDLSNLVSVGQAIFGATSVDNYVKTLVDHIGKVVFVNRQYKGNAPSVLMDGWEFGSVLQKIRAELPDAVVNDAWQLSDGGSPDPFKITLPKVSSKFFNDRATFEVDVTFAKRQVKSAFDSAEQLNSFFSMITNEVDKKMTIALDDQIKATIRYMIAETFQDAYGGNPVTGTTSTRAINLLTLFKAANPGNDTMTPKDAVTHPEFIRFAAYQLQLYRQRLSNISRLFNIGGTAKFTSEEFLHVIMLGEFKAGADIFLQSDTYNDEYTKLPNSEVLPFWQGSGTDYDFESTSKIFASTKVGPNPVTIEADGILAVMFDRDALGVTNLDRRVDTIYNPKAEYFNNFYKADAGYFVDQDENFLVFYVK